MALTTSALAIIKGSDMDSPKDLPEYFWKLVDRYRGELVNQALSILNNMEEAEDVVQESFCEAFRDSTKLAQVRSFGGWLRSINRANALNRLRDKSREKNKIDRKQQESPDSSVTTGGFSVLELNESVAWAVDALPSNLRTAILLHFWEHLSCEEIAVRTGLSVRTIRRQLYDATQLLFKKLKSHMTPPESAGAGSA